MQTQLQLFFDRFGCSKQQMPDDQKRLQAQIVLSFIFVYAVAWSIYLIAYLMLDNKLAALMVGLFGFPSASVGFYLFKVSGRVRLASTIANFGGITTLFGITLATGGGYSPIIAWIYFATITGYLICGTRVAIWLNVYTILGAAALNVLEASGLVFRWPWFFSLQSPGYFYFNAFTHFCTLFALGCVTVIFNWLIRKAVHEANQAKEQIEGKNRDIQAIFKNISYGIFSIGRNGTIDEGYSGYLEKVVGETRLAGKDPFSVLFRKAQLSAEQLDTMYSVLDLSIGELAWSFESNSYLLPSELVIQVEGEEKIIECAFDMILDRHEVISKILVAIRDVTEQRKIQLRAQKSQEEMEMVGELINIQHERFALLYDSAKRFIAENKLLIKSNKSCDDEVLKVLFVNLHTLKGNARTLGLKRIATKAHDVEHRYGLMRQGQQELWDPDTMSYELDDLDSTFDIYKKLATEKLNRADLKHQTTLDKSALITQIERLERNWLTQPQGFEEELQNFLSYLKAATGHEARALLEELTSDLSRLAKDLGKPTPVVSFDLDSHFVMHLHPI